MSIYESITMNINFSFFDLLSYLTPSALFFVFSLWFMDEFANFQIDIIQDSFEISIILFLLLYILGHLIQGIGKKIEEKNIRNLFKKDYQAIFLTDENPKFTKIFKNNLKLWIRDVFDYPISEISFSINDSEYNKANLEELFYLCYSMVRQKKVESYVPIFYSIRGLFRGLIVTFCGIIILSLMLVIKLIIMYIISFSIQNQTLILSIIVLFSSIYFAFLSISRFDHFTNLFTEYVYRDFYVWASTNIKTNKTEDSSINNKDETQTNIFHL